jgi:hypothetical protein
MKNDIFPEGAIMKEKGAVQLGNDLNDFIEIPPNGRG